MRWNHEKILENSSKKQMNKTWWEKETGCPRKFRLNPGRHVSPHYCQRKEVTHYGVRKSRLHEQHD